MLLLENSRMEDTKKVYRSKRPEYSEASYPNSRSKLPEYLSGEKNQEIRVKGTLKNSEFYACMRIFSLRLQ
jgi:hypothetical protein